MAHDQGVYAAFANTLRRARADCETIGDACFVWFLVAMAWHYVAVDIAALIVAFVAIGVVIGAVSMSGIFSLIRARPGTSHRADLANEWRKYIAGGFIGASVATMRACQDVLAPGVESTFGTCASCGVFAAAAYMLLSTLGEKSEADN